MNMLNGIFPAIITPFTRDGALDVGGLQTNFDAWNLTRLTGYLVLGSTGEVVHLEETEKLTVLEISRASIPTTMPMIVGTGQHSTRATIEFTRRAAELGATYALVVTPHYFKKEMTQAALKSFYLAVAEASTIPILLYSVPQFTGVQLAPETIAALAEHPNIAGIKDSSGDMRVLIHTLSLVENNFAVLTGSAPVLYPALLSGAKGAILAVANFIPDLCLETYRLAGQGKTQEARLFQERLLLISEAIASRHGIGGIKHAMNCVGYVGGNVRGPLEMPDTQAGQAIRACLQNSGCLRKN
jgi:4-hydroxy-2-oxoglutarate aldolase